MRSRCVMCIILRLGTRCRFSLCSFSVRRIEWCRFTQNLPRFQPGGHSMTLCGCITTLISKVGSRRQRLESSCHEAILREQGVVEMLAKSVHQLRHDFGESITDGFVPLGMKVRAWAHVVMPISPTHQSAQHRFQRLALCRSPPVSLLLSGKGW